MIEFKRYVNIPYNFTGVCKIIQYNSIRHYKNGCLHREDGPAIIYEDCEEWYIDGELHREDGPALVYGFGQMYFYYKGYQYSSDFTIETWKEFIKNLKREEELKIFI